MKRVLFIKLTSLGDLIHALPALTDAKRAHPEIQFDWVIDESFQEVASWHPAIEKSFATNHRKWRKNLFASLPSIRRLLMTMRETKYDLVLDGQGNFKSAMLALAAKGIRAGFDWPSVRESIASLAYQKKYPASWDIHAIDRLRRLFSGALHYPLPTTPPDFGLRQERFVKPAIDLPASYLVFVHNATWDTKLWPEAHWIELLRKVEEPVLLPWGNEKERARALRLAAASSKAIVLPRLSLSELGYIIARAKACVCLDTGLSHLAAALKVPAITLYGSTDAREIGASGEGQIHLQSDRFCAPCNKKSCRFPCVGLNPPCTALLTPDTVNSRLSLIRRR